MRRAFTVHPHGSWPEDEAFDTVTLAYLDRHRRRIRLVGDSGETFLLDLPRPCHLGDGDALELEEGGLIRVCAAPEAVIEIATDDRTLLLRIAWHLGNRHLPVQVTAAGLRIRADPVVAEMVRGLGGRVTARDAVFDPEAGAYSGGSGYDPHQH
jgi:urease accessory protein